MTPPQSARASTAAPGGHQRAVRRGTGPRSPRRVSGPSRAAGGARAARATAAATAAAAAVNPNQLPFEVPVGRRAVARPVGLPRNHTPLAHRLGRVAEHSVLDRLLRSRGWIVLVALGLIGLVFMQVSLLRLNSGMGANVEKATVLERDNAVLRASVSKLEAVERLMKVANDMGMVLPASDGVRYLGRGGKQVGGGAVTAVPSQAEAALADVPAVTDPANPATPGTTAPATTSSVPDAAVRGTTDANGITVAPSANGTTGTGTGAATGATGTVAGTATGTAGTGTGTGATGTGMTGTGTAGTATGTGTTGTGTTGTGTTGTATGAATAGTTAPAPATGTTGATQTQTQTPTTQPQTAVRNDGSVAVGGASPGG